jgi:hypothetical protein
VEDQENRLVLLGSDGILDILLVLAEELWVKLDVTRLVDAVNISETGSNREERRDRRQSLVDSEDILGLGVEGVVVDGLVVNTILLTASDTDLLRSEVRNYLQPGISDCLNLPSQAIASLVPHASSIWQWC